MKTAITLIVIAAVLMLIVAIAAKGKGAKQTAHSNIKAKPVLTPNEQPMYFRLTEALPEYIVLCQVAFSALLDTKLRATRNTFDRKVADFVICRKSFGVVAIVELDDASHNGRAKQDAERDAILINAGYKVLRYRRVPDVSKIREDLKAAFTTTASTQDKPKPAIARTERREPVTMTTPSHQAFADDDLTRHPNL